jgi:phosphatidate cytidylyltransferase
MNRVIPGVLLAGGWFLLLFLGSPQLLWGVVAGGAAIALHEYFRMTCASLVGASLWATIACCLLPVLCAFTGASDAVLAGVVGSLLAVVAMALHGYAAISDVFRYVSCSGFASLYISLCLAHVVLIRFLPQGPLWLTLLVAVVAGSDTGAYYAGRAFGRRKLFPQISPKKTVAGGVGGLVAGMVAAEIVNLLFPVKANPGVLLLAAGLLIVVGIAGDLTESMIKRSVGVKDSGTILFGHGGLLDRIDSLLLTAPVLYCLLRFGVL